MRFALVAVLLATVAGCPVQSTGGDGYGTYPPGGPGPGGPGTETGCKTDSDCGSEVCARDGECLPAADVRHIAVTWTIGGAAANATTCASEPDLEIQFMDDLVSQTGDGVGFAPVPCDEGKFSVDKMPTRFAAVELGNEYDTSTDTSGVFDGSGNVSLDLP